MKSRSRKDGTRVIEDGTRVRKGEIRILLRLGMLMKTGQG